MRLLYREAKSTLSTKLLHVDSQLSRINLKIHFTESFYFLGILRAAPSRTQFIILYIRKNSVLSIPLISYTVSKTNVSYNSYNKLLCGAYVGN